MQLLTIELLFIFCTSCIFKASNALNVDVSNRLTNSDICYEGYGCFTTRPPFSGTLARPIALLPDTPERVRTTFYLYTRNNPSNRTKFLINETNADFDITRETKFIIHGFLHNGIKKFILNMKDALLEAGDSNVIIVDWSRGNGFPYAQATANTQIVGADIAILVNSLVNKGLKASDVHIIGHNLGAHAAGYAGKRIKHLGRITGLDPAGPYFENSDPKVRLDESDADFVDVIHTDASPLLQVGFGITQRCGHADFYPNGGKEQPSCAGATQKIINGLLDILTLDIDGFEKESGCSHLAAVHFFTDSINNKDCKYVSYPCNNDEDFNVGKCMRCSASGCNQMGYWASPRRDTGTLYLHTQDADSFPYCLHHFVITLNSDDLDKNKRTRGRFTIELIGDVDKSSLIVLDDDETVFKPGSSEVRVKYSTKNIGEKVDGAVLHFKKTSGILTSWLYANEWNFKNIEINYGDSQYSVKLCPVNTTIVSESNLKFEKC